MNPKLPSPPASEFARPGEDNGRAKLTEDDVRLMRRLVADGMSGKLAAEKFDVSCPLVSLICARKRWAHVQ